MLTLWESVLASPPAVTPAAVFAGLRVAAGFSASVSWILRLISVAWDWDESVSNTSAAPSCHAHKPQRAVPHPSSSTRLSAREPGGNRV